MREKNEGKKMPKMKIKKFNSISDYCTLEEFLELAPLAFQVQELVQEVDTAIYQEVLDFTKDQDSLLLSWYQSEDTRTWGEIKQDYINSINKNVEWIEKILSNENIAQFELETAVNQLYLCLTAAPKTPLTIAGTQGFEIYDYYAQKASDASLPSGPSLVLSEDFVVEDGVEFDVPKQLDDLQKLYSFSDYETAKQWIFEETKQRLIDLFAEIRDEKSDFLDQNFKKWFVSRMATSEQKTIEQNRRRITSIAAGDILYSVVAPYPFVESSLLGSTYLKRFYQTRLNSNNNRLNEFIEGHINYRGDFFTTFHGLRDLYKSPFSEKPARQLLPKDNTNGYPSIPYTNETRSKIKDTANQLIPIGMREDQILGDVRDYFENDQEV